MLIKKNSFIKRYLTIIKKKLERDLPDEDYEYEMMDYSKQIIKKHIWGEK